MAQLTTLSSDIKRIREHDGHVYIFSAAGVDIYSPGDKWSGWIRIGYASLANVVGGHVNSNGVYLATAANGVYRLPLTSDTGDVSADLVQQYATGTTPAIQSNAIHDIDGASAALIIAHAAGVEYLPGPATVYKNAILGGMDRCACKSDEIAYGIGDTVYIAPIPAADWTNATDTIDLDGATLNALAYGTELFIGHSDGLHSWVGSYTVNLTPAIGTVTDVKALYPTADAASYDYQGRLAFGTSDGEGGGLCGVFDFYATGEFDLYAIYPGDCPAVWISHPDAIAGDRLMPGCTYNLWLSNRVSETTASEGEDDYILAEADVVTDGFGSFYSCFMGGDDTCYCCTDGQDWEVGIGQFVEEYDEVEDAYTLRLVRTNVLDSSMSADKIEWGPGTKNIFATAPAEIFPIIRPRNPNPALDFPRFVGVQFVNSMTGEIFVCVDNSVGGQKWIGQMGTVIEET